MVVCNLLSDGSEIALPRWTENLELGKDKGGRATELWTYNLNNSVEQVTHWAGTDQWLTGMVIIFIMLRQGYATIFGVITLYW